VPLANLDGALLLCGAILKLKERSDIADRVGNHVPGQIGNFVSAQPSFG
jgi:hypothetical protein